MSGTCAPTSDQTIRIADPEKAARAKDLSLPYLPVWAEQTERQLGDGPFLCQRQTLDIVDLKLYLAVRWFAGGKPITFRRRFCRVSQAKPRPRCSPRSCFCARGTQKLKRCADPSGQSNTGSKKYPLIVPLAAGPQHVRDLSAVTPKTAQRCGVSIRYPTTSAQVRRGSV